MDAFPSKLGHWATNKRAQQIFSDEQEAELSKFVRDASDYYNGITSKDVRILAFVYGVCNQVDLPEKWQHKHEASFAWCSGFAKRNKLILLSMVSNSHSRKKGCQSKHIELCGDDENSVEAKKFNWECVFVVALPIYFYLNKT